MGESVFSVSSVAFAIEVLIFREAPNLVNSYGNFGSSSRRLLNAHPVLGTADDELVRAGTVCVSSAAP